MTDPNLPPSAPVQPIEPFEPVDPEPFAPSAYEASMASPVRTGGGITPSSARVMSIALAAAVLVAAVGVAFAVGRGTAPASTVSTNTGQVGSGGLPGGDGQPGGLDASARPGATFGPGGDGQPGGLPGGDDNGGPGRGFGRNPGGISIEATVQSATATTVVVTLPNGQTVTLPIDASTTFHAQVAATLADVTAGQKVLVRITGGFGDDDNQNGSGPAVGDITIVP